VDSYRDAGACSSVTSEFRSRPPDAAGRLRGSGTGSAVDEEAAVKHGHIGLDPPGADPRLSTSAASGMGLRRQEGIGISMDQDPAVHTNVRTLDAFKTEVTRHWLHPLRRRSQKSCVTWEKMDQPAARWLPRPRILHPWPGQRFAAMTQGKGPVL